jgi:nitroreductase
MPNPETDIAALSVPEAASARRSIRRFRQEPIDRADLDRIFETVRLAPSAFNVQPWRFVVVTDPDLKARISAAANGQRQVASAPAVIVLYTDMADALDRIEDAIHPDVPDERRASDAAGFRKNWANRSETDREQWGAAQGNIALGYLLLAAAAYGYATAPMLGFDPKKVKAALGLPEHAMIPALVAIGIADEEGFTHHRHTLDTLVSYR